MIYLVNVELIIMHPLIKSFVVVNVVDIKFLFSIVAWSLSNYLPFNPILKVITLIKVDSTTLQRPGGFHLPLFKRMNFVCHFKRINEKHKANKE